MYVLPHELKVGDRFSEDPWPEIWEVTEENVTEEIMVGCRARVVDDGYDAGDETRVGDESFWGNAPGYSFTTIRRRD